MGDITLRTLGYAILAAASPVTVLATLVVLTSGRGRLNGVAFLASFLLGQSVVCVVGLFVSATAVEKLEGHADTGVSIFKLVLGVVLLVAAGMGHRRTGTREPAASARTEALLARLERIRPATAFSAGLALGIGFKRLIITLVAMTTIAAADLSSADEASLVVLYVAVASLSVWPAVALYLVVGEHARTTIDAAKRWLTANSTRVTYYITLVIGAYFCADGLAGLV
jgi:2-methylaconitate cis-trans-isomerase PrpF